MGKKKLHVTAGEGCQRRPLAVGGLNTTEGEEQSQINKMSTKIKDRRHFSDWADLR